MKKCGSIFSYSRRTSAGFLVPVLSIFLTQACSKSSVGHEYDFTNTLPPYVSLSSLAAKTVRQGTTTTFTFVMRTALQQDVTATYSVAGAVNMQDKTIVIPKDKTSAVAAVAIPGNVIPTPGTTAHATLTLERAVSADGKRLTIGQKNEQSNQKVAITITN